VFGRIGLGTTLGYADVAIVRWQQMTGKQAVRAESDKIFEEVGLERSNPDSTLEATE